MKKIVLTHGLIAGAILSAMMALTVPFMHRIDTDVSLLIGYTSMVLGFLFIYFGVRSYRDTVGRGRIGFGRAFATGALIALVGSACYVATWEVIYFNFTPNFMEEYQARVLQQERAAGASEAALAAKRAEMAKMAELYKNPLFNAAITFAEPLPVGLVIALVSAGVLSRRQRDERDERDERDDPAPRAVESDGGALA